MRILGLDPAARCGFAWTDGTSREHGVWQITTGDGEHPGARLERFRARIYEVHRRLGIDELAYEDAQQGSHNFRTQGLHAELRGVIKLVAAELNLPPPTAINPMTLKAWATGSGRADKDQMIRAAQTLLGIATDDHNVADALFVLELAKNPAKIAGPKTIKRRVAKRRKRDAKLF